MTGTPRQIRTAIQQILSLPALPISVQGHKYFCENLRSLNTARITVSPLFVPRCVLCYGTRYTTTPTSNYNTSLTLTKHFALSTIYNGTPCLIRTDSQLLLRESALPISVKGHMVPSGGFEPPTNSF